MTKEVLQKICDDYGYQLGEVEVIIDFARDLVNEFKE